MLIFFGELQHLIWKSLFNPLNKWRIAKGINDYPFCASFAQASFSVMVRFSTSLPDALSLSNAK